MESEFVLKGRIQIKHIKKCFCRFVPVDGGIFEIFLDVLHLLWNRSKYPARSRISRAITFWASSVIIG